MKTEINDPEHSELAQGAEREGNDVASDIAGAQPTPTPQEMEQLKAQAEKAAEYHDMLLRTAAEFDNYKKRIAREKQESAKLANEAILQKLIPVLDNFEMALAAVGNTQNISVESMQTGVNMILQQLKSTLKDTGLEEINATGQKFDPNVHEALSQQESAEVPEGQVLQQLRKGYKLRDRLLRPAGVIVSKAPEKPRE
jgi:molecular chaperone GrpE